MNRRLAYEKICGDINCGRHICPRAGEDNLACMKKIPVEIVMKYVFELLDAYGQPAKKIPRVHGAYQCRVVNLTR